jgi:hypothetical protein
VRVISEFGCATEAAHRLCSVVEVAAGAGEEERTKKILTRELPNKGISLFAGNAAVFSLVQRGGKVLSTYMEHRVTQKNLRPVLDAYLVENAHVMTDSSPVVTVTPDQKHDKVDHTAKEYVRYENGVFITTNTGEGYFVTLKRGIDGVYHHVSKRHPNRHLSEFDFRYNSRQVSDAERRDLAIKQVGGKRLKYRDSSGSLMA